MPRVWVFSEQNNLRPLVDTILPAWDKAATKHGVQTMIAAVLTIFTLAGLALIAGILISDGVEHRRHTRGLEANNRRRHGVS